MQDDSTRTRTCQTCWFWNSSERWPPKPFGRCQRIDTVYNATEPATIDELALVTTDCAANLVTKPDFGCVLWSE